MRQTKKLTRGQHEYLQRNGVYTKDCRLVEETNEYVKFQKPNGEVEVFWKGVSR